MVDQERESRHLETSPPEYQYFEVQNAVDDTAHVLLYDKIGVDQESGEGISGRRFAEELYMLSRQYRRINVRINSSGGKVIDGLSICSAILNINKTVSGVRVDTYVDGLALSIAGLIAVCGKMVYMSNFAQLMVHNPFIPPPKETGTEKESKATTSEPSGTHRTLHQIKEMLVTLLTTRTGLSPEMLSSMMNSTTWLNAEEALQQGFVDEIFEHPRRKSIEKSLGSLINSQDDTEAGAENEQGVLIEVFNAHPVDLTTMQESQTISGAALAPDSSISSSTSPTVTQTQHQVQTSKNQTKNSQSMTTIATNVAGTANPTFSAEDVERLRNEVTAFKGDLSAIINACGLVSDAGRDGIIHHINAQAAKIKELTPLELSIDNFKTNIETLKNEKAKLEEKVAEMKRYEADTLIERAINEGKIAPAKKEKWLSHAYDNYERVRETLADMPVHPNLASKIKAMGSGEVGNGNGHFEQLSFSELSNQYPEKLELIKNENFELYKTLFRKEYGTEPSF